MQNALPVLIVGAGPTGLMMAIELNRHGIPFRIIDKKIKPVPTSNALAVQTRTLYAWKDIGLLPNALSRGEKITAFNCYSQDKKLASIQTALLAGDMKFILGLAQHDTEQMFLDHLKEKNITVEMEVDVLDIQEKEDGIKVNLQHKDGKQEEINTDWLLACDGGHSFIREKLNVPFEGKKLVQHFVLADAEIQSDLAKNEGHFFVSEKGIFVLIQFNNKFSRIIVEVSQNPVLKDAKSLTYDEVKQLAAELCPVKLNISEPTWTSGFWIHESIIANYRCNRTFFAGDAAHLHSPAGGQGMNTGLQDAYNLAWKLAHVIQKKASDALLDTYHTERYQVGKKVVRNASILTHVVTANNYILKKVRDFLMFHVSKIPFIQKRIITTITELNIKYSNSLLAKDCLPLRPGPKPGTFKADMFPELADMMQGMTSFVLLLFATKLQEPKLFIDFKNEFKYAHLVKCIYINDDVSGWHDLSLVDADLKVHESFGVTKPGFYLIRPDKYIGIRGELKHKEELEKYFAQFT